MHFLGDFVGELLGEGRLGLGRLLAEPVNVKPSGDVLGLDVLV